MRGMQSSDNSIEAANVAGTTTNPDLAPEEAVHETIHLPPPTIWPVVTAGGVATAGLGLVTWWPFCIVGILLMMWGLTAWIQELRHELH